MKTVRTRFAPSPTGYMHIGGMRTALFNWLFARHHGGQFILRIDDTDQSRHQEEALGPILRAFRWLGLNWDEGPEVGGPYGPYYQSERGPLYQAACEQLLASGKAYYDFSTKEEVEADRKAAEAAKQNYMNSRRSLDLTDAERTACLAEDRPYVIRFLVPRGETVAVDDLIRGHVEWDTSLIPDPVIMRGNGIPLYNFATVVDDAQLQISHVIRAEEHLTNTAVQILFYQALGYDLPEFAHVPYVASPGSKEKMSKRKIDKYRKNPKFKGMFDKGDAVFPQIGLADVAGLDPVMVEYYERIGYLPVAVLNALGRLGWSLDSETEILSLQTLIENFTLDRVVKAPAGFDPDKLLSFQTHWMRELPMANKVTSCVPYLVKASLIQENPSADMLAFIETVIEAYGERLKLFSDILDCRYFFTDDYPCDEKNFRKRVAKEGIPALLTEFSEKLSTVEPFTVATLESALQTFVQEKNIPMGDMIHALRLSTTGTAVGPGLYECLMILGPKRVNQRIARAVAQV